MSPLVRAGQIGSDINPLEVALQGDALVPAGFNDWIPDLSPVGHPGLLDAVNCVPLTNSFGELRNTVAVTDGISDKVLAHTWAQSTDSAYHNFAADRTNIYRLLSNNTTWQTVGTGYDTLEWGFVVWGSFVIALSPNQAPQVLDASLGTNEMFADLPGSPPTAGTGAVMRDFLVLGQIENLPNRVQWSGYDDITQWEPSFATLSDYQDLPAYLGRVQRIVPGDYGLIFTEHGIVRMSLFDTADANVSFRFDVLERGIGTPAPRSVCWLGDTVFFYSQAGFYAFDGQNLVPIGSNVVDRWFRERVTHVDIREMQGVVDRSNSLVFWAFRTGSEDNYDSLLVYNFESNRWSHSDSFDCELLTEFVSSNLSLEDLDTFFPDGINAGSAESFDSAVYAGGELDLTVFDTSNRMATLSGPPLPARFVTGEKSLGGDLMFCENIRFLVDAGSDSTSIDGYVVHRDDMLSADHTTEGPFSVNANGDASCLVSSRFQRYRVDVSGGFRHAYGIIPKVRAAGDIGAS